MGWLYLPLGEGRQMRPIQEERHQANESGGALGRKLVARNSHLGVAQSLADLVKGEVLHKLGLWRGNGGGRGGRDESLTRVDVEGEKRVETVSAKFCTTSACGGERGHAWEELR
jgi:hypothetical protein